MKCIWIDVCVLWIVYFVAICIGDNDLARGWNDNINWVNLEDGEKLSQSQNRPMMLVIHKSWCGACKALKPQFAAYKPIEELSKVFVMVNTLDDEEPKDAKFTPDGAYIPRILFRDPQGTILTDIINEQGNDQYKYYYHDPEHILLSMHKCLEKVQGSSKAAFEEL